MLQRQLHSDRSSRWCPCGRQRNSDENDLIESEIDTESCADLTCLKLVSKTSKAERTLIDSRCKQQAARASGGHWHDTWVRPL